MAKEAPENDGWDNPENEIQSNWMKFNVSATDDPKGADKIHGTLLRKYKQKSNLNPEKEQWVYEIQADEDSTYHALDKKKKLIEEPIQINKGDIYSVGGTTVLDRQMTNVKRGQIIGMKYIEEQEAKRAGNNPTKVIKVYVSKNEDGTVKFDEEFLASDATPEA